MTATVHTKHTGGAVRTTRFPSMEAAKFFTSWAHRFGSEWRVEEVVLVDDMEFIPIPDSPEASGPFLLNNHFEWQLGSNTPTVLLEAEKLPDTGEYDLYLL